MAQVDLHHTRKMLVKASIMHILEAQCPPSFFSKNESSVIFNTGFLSFMAIANKSHNIPVLEACKVPELIDKFLLVSSWHVIKQLDSNLLPILMHSLFGISHCLIFCL
jgi:hypothetical protein